MVLSNRGTQIYGRFYERDICLQALLILDLREGGGHIAAVLISAIFLPRKRSVGRDLRLHDYKFRFTERTPSPPSEPI